MSPKPHWYFIHVTACALCGKTKVDRERRYDERPGDPAKRREYIETACQGHFL